MESISIKTFYILLNLIVLILGRGLTKRPWADLADFNVYLKSILFSAYLLYFRVKLLNCGTIQKEVVRAVPKRNYHFTCYSGTMSAKQDLCIPAISMQINRDRENTMTRKPKDIGICTPYKI